MQKYHTMEEKILELGYVENCLLNFVSCCSLLLVVSQNAITNMSQI